MSVLKTLPTSAGQDIGTLAFTGAVTSPWVSLLSGAAQAIAIPPGSKWVRFAYNIGSANVYVSPDAIVIPTAGSTEFSRTETNPMVRGVGSFAQEGITALNLVSDADTTVHLYFYTE